MHGNRIKGFALLLFGLCWMVSLHGQEALCGDAVDNDGDGLVDCDDGDCNRFINLLTNPSFEDYVCVVPVPSNAGNLDAAVADWSNLSGTADAYFFASPICQFRPSEHEPALSNIAPSDGDVYVGFHNRNPGLFHQHEPLVQTLSNEIVSGNYYRLGFDAYQFDFSAVPYVFNNAGVIEVYGIESGTAIGGFTWDACDLTVNAGVDLLGTSAAVNNTAGWQEYTVNFTATKNYDRFIFAVACGLDSYLGMDNLSLAVQPTLSSTGSCTRSTLTAAGALVGETYVWYKDGVEISGVLSSTLVPNTSGNYTVAIQTATGCGVSMESTAVSIDGPTVAKDTLFLCDAGGGTADFTLSDADAQVSSGAAGVVVSYHGSQADAEGDLNALSSPYTSASDVLHIRVERTVDGCYALDTLTLTVYAVPDINITDPGDQCGSFDLQQLVIADANAVAGIDTTFHQALPLNAADMSDQLVGAALTLTSSTKVYVMMANTGSGCFDVDSISVVVLEEPQINLTDPGIQCGTFNLDSLVVTDPAGASGTDTTFHTVLPTNGADLSNVLSGAAKNLTGSDEIYVMIASGSSCYAIDSIDVTVLDEPDITVTDPGVQCGSFDLNNLVVTDANAAGGATTSYHTVLPADGSDNSGVLSGGGLVLTASDEIYVRIATGTNCYSLDSVDVSLFDAPDIALNDPGAQCGGFDLSTLTFTDANNASGTDTTYHSVLPTAGTDMTNQLTGGALQLSATAKVYVMVATSAVCFSVDSLTITVYDLPDLSVSDPGEQCGSFDLTNLVLVDANGVVGATTSYHDALPLDGTDLSDELTGGALIVQDTGWVYVMMVTDQSCYSVDSVEVFVHPQPDISVTQPGAQCAPYALTDLQVVDANNAEGMTITYHANQPTHAGDFSHQLGSTNLNSDQVVYVMVSNTATGCFDTTRIALTVNEQPFIQVQFPGKQCDNYDVGDLVVNDLNGVSGTTTTYHNQVPSSGSDLSNVLASNTLILDQVVYVMVAHPGTGCYSVDSTSVQFFEPLTVEPLSDTSLCPGFANYRLNAEGSGGTVLYSWEGQAYQNNGIYDVTAGGTYTVSIVNECDTIEQTSIVTVLDELVIDAFSDTAICSNSELVEFEVVVSSFAGDDAVFPQYIWNGDSGQDQAVFSTADKGYYNVRVVDACGSELLGFEIAYLEDLELDPLQDETICEGDSASGMSAVPSFGANPISYLWSTGSTAAQIHPQQAGEYRVEVSNGCFTLLDTVQLNVITSFTVPALLNDTVCAGDSLVLEMGIGRTDVQYLWSTGSTDSSIVVAEEKEYWVRIKNTCFEERDSMRLAFAYPVELDWPADTLICEDETIRLDAFDEAYVSYDWSTGSSGSSINVWFPGVFEVRVQDRFCADTAQIEVFIKDSVFVDLPQLLEVCYGDSVELSPILTDPDVNFEWSTGETTSSVYVQDSSLITLVIWDDKCQYQDQASTLVRVDECAFGIFIPNAFTPNGDGTNDYFGAVSSNVFESFELSIFNRWGELVYKANDIDGRWNGRTPSAQLVHDGVYVWRILYRHFDDDGDLKEVVLRGHVTLLR